MKNTVFAPVMRPMIDVDRINANQVYATNLPGVAAFPYGGCVHFATAFDLEQAIRVERADDEGDWATVDWDGEVQHWPHLQAAYDYAESLAYTIAAMWPEFPPILPLKV
jgi:hypothetical protein